jgi:hypothetical protein
MLPAPSTSAVPATRTSPAYNSRTACIVLVSARRDERPRRCGARAFCRTGV